MNTARSRPHQPLRKLPSARVTPQSTHRLQSQSQSQTQSTINMFGICFIKTPPTTYLLQFRNGKIVREGTGLSFFYYAPTASLVAIPVGSSDEPFIFEEKTADHQAITLQGQVTYRVAEPRKLAGLMNFTLAPHGRYLSEDPEKLPQRVINLVHVLARGELEKLPLRDAMRAAERIVDNVRKALATSPEIGALGIEVIGLSILAIRPTPETARALEARDAGATPAQGR